MAPFVSSEVLRMRRLGQVSELCPEGPSGSFNESAPKVDPGAFRPRWRSGRAGEGRTAARCGGLPQAGRQECTPDIWSRGVPRDLVHLRNPRLTWGIPVPVGSVSHRVCHVGTVAWYEVFPGQSVFHAPVPRVPRFLAVYIGQFKSAPVGSGADCPASAPLLARVPSVDFLVQAVRRVYKYRLTWVNTCTT